MRRATLAIGWAIALAAMSSRASADGDPCLTAPVDGQKLQRAGKLLEARERFAVCARKMCPPEIVQDCTRWADDVNGALPSIVVAARDASGRDLVDVRVSVDGQEPFDVSARAIDLNPGAHRLVFQRAAGEERTREVLLREGEKRREVVAIFDQPIAAPPPARPSEASQETQRPLPLLFWVAGGVSVIGFASFATFGAMGVSSRSSDHCDTGCPATKKDAVDTSFLVADISLGVGVVAGAAATWLFFSRPTVTTTTQRPASLDVHPTKGGGIANLSLRF